MATECPRLDLFVTIGEQLEVTITLPTADNGWRSLTGATGLAQVRLSAASTVVKAEFSVDLDADDETAILTLAADESDNLVVNSDYEWDLRLSWVDGDVIYPVAGVLRVRGAVSRP